MSESTKGKYESKGDFGSYNEPSWVPEGYCKCCSMTTPELGEPTRKPTEKLVPLFKLGVLTQNKNLSVVQCPNCDHKVK